MGCRNSVGNICTSSKTTTEFAMLCTFLLRDTLWEKRLSKNCTFVVTMIGASQFSASRRVRS